MILLAAITRLYVAYIIIRTRCIDYIVIIYYHPGGDLLQCCLLTMTYASISIYIRAIQQQYKYNRSTSCYKIMINRHNILRYIS